jgi:hypothetical protein
MTTWGKNDAGHVIGEKPGNVPITCFCVEDRPIEFIGIRRAGACRGRRLRRHGRKGRAGVVLDEDIMGRAGANGRKHRINKGINGNWAAGRGIEASLMRVGVQDAADGRRHTQIPVGELAAGCDRVEEIDLILSEVLNDANAGRADVGRGAGYDHDCCETCTNLHHVASIVSKQSAGSGS